MTQRVLLFINISPGLEEEFVDALLSNKHVEGYQCHPTSGHGQVGAMTLAEQVAGRRNRVQFELLLDTELVEPVLGGLKTALPSPDIIWWTVPVSATGRLSDRP